MSKVALGVIFGSGGEKRRGRRSRENRKGQALASDAE